jgi:hypothetical protein
VIVETNRISRYMEKDLIKAVPVSAEQLFMLGLLLTQREDL